MLLIGWKQPPPNGKFLGTSTDPAWPYRYTLARTGGVWSGSIDYKTTNGWVLLDTMEIIKQDRAQIEFMTRISTNDQPGFLVIRIPWLLNLKDESSNGFSGAIYAGPLSAGLMVDLSFVPQR